MTCKGLTPVSSSCTPPPVLGPPPLMPARSGETLPMVLAGRRAQVGFPKQQSPAGQGKDLHSSQVRKTIWGRPY